MATKYLLIAACLVAVMATAYGTFSCYTGTLVGGAGAFAKQLGCGECGKSTNSVGSVKTVVKECFRPGTICKSDSCCSTDLCNSATNLTSGGAFIALLVAALYRLI